MTELQKSADNSSTTNSSTSPWALVETSLRAVAARYGVSTDRAISLYQQFFPQAESFHLESGLNLKAPPWKLALQQVVRELARPDLGDLALGNYFEYWRRKESARPLYMEPAPDPISTAQLSARETFSPTVTDALNALYRRYMTPLVGGDIEHDSIHHLYTSLLRFKALDQVGDSTHAEILDELLMMLSFSVGDLPRTPLTTD